MSFILDALKRADAERERGRVPGLHSQTPLPTAAVAAPSAQSTRLGWLLGLPVLSAAALAWWFWPSSRDTAPIPEPSVVSAPAPAAEPTPLSTAPAPAPAPAPSPAEATPVATPTTKPSLQTPVAPLLSPPLAAPVQGVPAAGTTSPTPVVPAAQPPKPADPGPVRRLADLPADQRAQLPRLAVSGASYSQNPAHRMLIVNGTVVQEGPEIAPGLKLERIGPNEAVLNQRGLRFSVAY